MNILYIHTHDTGRYIQPYGFPVPTPRLMSLAREGTLFRQAYTAAPTCSPSRASLLTGTVPHSCGMLGLAHRGFRLHDYSQHLVQYLNAQDYETVLCGMHHESPDTDDIGYRTVLADFHNDEQVRDPLECDVTNAGLAASFLVNRDRSRPFFLSYGMHATHRTFPSVPESTDTAFVHPPFPIPDTRETRRDTAEYIAAAGIADTCIGVVLDALRRSGEEENTIVLFVTDHGLAFPQMKCTLYDTGIGVSLILKYPGNPKKGGAVDSLVSLIDIYPTLADLISIPHPPWLQGHSLLPVLRGEVSEVRDEVFSEITYHAAYQPMRSVRTKRYKFIRNFGPSTPVAANIDDGLTKDFLLEQGYLNQEIPARMLFDLDLDPTERINLATSPAHKGIRDDLNARLDRWMRETDDPLLHGHVPAPAGARINAQTCISADEAVYE